MMTSGLIPPEGTWWRPIPRDEKRWITVSFVWCMIMFAIMPLWHWKGGQNPGGIRGKVSPKEFRARTKQFIEQRKVGVENGIPVCRPEPGEDVYLQASMWRWEPVLILEKGKTYTIHLSSVDVNHGFGLYPTNLNFQVVPGYDYGLRMTPNESGDFRIICNEFCGIGHHTMVGKIVVEE